MVPVFINEKETFGLPESWNELTGEQLCAIAPYFFQDEITSAQRGAIACVFTVRNYNSIRTNEFYCHEWINKIIPRLDFLFKDIKLTAQLLPFIEVKKRFKFFGTTTLYGPVENFDNLTIAEFNDTEYCLEQYQATKEVVWLNRFIAILYRPKRKGADTTNADFTGDVRQAYNFYLNDFIGIMVSKVDTGVKMAVMLWYLGCRAVLVEDYKFLFNAKNTTAAQTGSWTDVIHGLAGPKFGTIDETMHANLKVVLKELSILKQQADELAANQPV